MSLREAPAKAASSTHEMKLGLPPMPLEHVDLAQQPSYLLICGGESRGK